MILYHNKQTQCPHQIRSLYCLAPTYNAYDLRPRPSSIIPARLRPTIFNIQYPQARPPSTSALPFFPTSVRFLSYFLVSFGLFLSQLGLGSGLSLVHLCHFTLSPIHLSLSRSFRLAFLLILRDCSRAHAPHLFPFLLIGTGCYSSLSLWLCLGFCSLLNYLHTYIPRIYCRIYSVTKSSSIRHSLIANQFRCYLLDAIPPPTFGTSFCD